VLLRHAQKYECTRTAMDPRVLLGRVLRFIVQNAPGRLIEPRAEGTSSAVLRLSPLEPVDRSKATPTHSVVGDLWKDRKSRRLRKCPADDVVPRKANTQVGRTTRPDSRRLLFLRKGRRRETACASIHTANNQICVQKGENSRARASGVPQGWIRRPSFPLCSRCFRSSERNDKKEKKKSERIVTWLILPVVIRAQSHKKLVEVKVI
jgi:hypothetical protein